MKTLIMTDENSGISSNEAKTLGIAIIKMPVIIDGNTYFEDINLKRSDFYKALIAKKDIITSQPAIGLIEEEWNKYLLEYDEILYIPMSSELSHSYESAYILSKNYNGKVEVVDNHRISVTLKSSVLDAIKLIKTGKTAKEIKEILEKESYESSIYIMLTTLEYLKKGGRITPAGALLGGALHIKPILQIQGGKLDAYQKVIGEKKAKKVLIDAIKYDLENKFNKYLLSELRISFSYTYDLKAAMEFKKEACKILKLNEDQIFMDELPVSVTTHIGPNALAITISHKL